MKGRKKNSYSDGIAEFYKKKDIKKKVRRLYDNEYMGFLYYDEKTRRQQDIEFAEQLGNHLELKIVTPDDGNMDTNRNVVIEGVIYAIIHIDRDKEKKELYFYLEEVRRIER